MEYVASEEMFADIIIDVIDSTEKCLKLCQESLKAFSYAALNSWTDLSCLLFNFRNKQNF